MPKLLLSIDPGLMTGISLLDYTDSLNPVIVWSDEWDIKTFFDKIESVIKENKDNLSIVCENFIYTKETVKKSVQPYSTELIGITKLLCYRYSVPLTMHKPGDREFSTHPKLKKVGLWHVGGAGHAKVSLQHALVWLLGNDGRLAKRLLD